CLTGKKMRTAAAAPSKPTSKRRRRAVDFFMHESLLLGAARPEEFRAKSPRTQRKARHFPGFALISGQPSLFIFAPTHSAFRKRAPSLKGHLPFSARKRMSAALRFADFGGNTMGADRRRFRPCLESLEDRFLLASSLLSTTGQV